VDIAQITAEYMFLTEELGWKDSLDKKEVIRGQTHLDDTQKQDLRELLNDNDNEHTKLFDGTLGVYPHKEVHIELEPDAKPVHARAYPVPKIHEAAYKKELFHLVKLGVLAYQGTSDWASPSFIIPKKDGRVRSNIQDLFVQR
jgi:hypothetical protein